MGEKGSLWGYAEEHGELGQKLLYTNLELEKLKSEAMEEMTKNKQYINHLIQLLKCTIEERDEARKQLEKLIMSSAADEIFPTIPHFHGKPNSSIIESNSLSETHNYHSAAVLPQQPDMKMVVQDFVSSFPNVNIDDRGSLIVENLSKGRVLPRKGMLLQAVFEAGPLLQTLMLPRCQNPPQMQSFDFKYCHSPSKAVRRRAQLTSSYS